MKSNVILKWASLTYISFCILSIGYLSITAMIDPQSTMDFVNIKLDNNDAISSIRGVYGGVGIAITILLIYYLINNIKGGLIFLSLFWGLYAISRIITIIVDGALGDFGKQWLMIETVLFIIGVITFTLHKKTIK